MDAKYRENFKDIRDLIDKNASVKPKYFIDYLKSLIFLVTVIQNKAFKTSQKTMISEGANNSSSVVHQNLVYAIDNNLPIFSTINLDIWVTFVKTVILASFQSWGFLIKSIIA